MGTITRNFANNLTTSGLLKPTAFNNDSFDNVTAVPSGSVETGAMQFISSATASASASIEFTSGIDSTYKEYVFYFVNIHAGTTLVNFTFQASTDSGSNYNTTVTSTAFQAYHREDGGDYLFGYNGSVDKAQATDFIRLQAGSQLGTGNDENFCGYLHLYNPSSTTFVKHWTAVSNLNDLNSPGYSVNSFLAGYFNTTSAIDAVKFQMDSGNIDAGQILLFGIN